jgi:FkbM family methyltransferase
MTSVRASVEATLRDWLGLHWRRCYSQEGEDMILRRVFEHKADGFYVDVGAHHPMRFSNTHFFYRRGWRGINVDARPGSKRVFDRARRRDVNVECGIARQAGVANYYEFNEPALNGFSASLSGQRDGRSDYRIVATHQVQVVTLRELLDAHLPPGQQIDFLSIDVEGLDLDVVLSNDWEKYRPAFVLVEILGTSLGDVIDSPIAQAMAAEGYEIFAKCVNTVFFRKT